jgi:UDP-N-acetylmuramoylalanine--D-glutamate ligase
MKINELHGKRILILGYGKEGRATCAFLEKFVPDAFIDTADQTDSDDYLDKQSQFDLAIKTPGIPGRYVTIPYTTATNLFFDNLPAGVRTIGVTGSKGKSTTSSLIYAILKEAGVEVRLAGNIGKPMLAELMDSVKSGTVFVLELSSYQLEDLEFSPDIAVFLNVFAEHLDYHGSMQSYVAAKSRIAGHMKPDGVFLFNRDNAFIADLASRVTCQVEPFLPTLPFSMSDLPLKGKHNELNIRAALTVAKIFHVSPEVARRAVEHFVPLPHRLEFVGEFGGIKFYDDAIATAPEPTMFAIETLGNVDTIFLGGTDRGLDFTQLAKSICMSGIRNVVLFPDTGSRIKIALENHCDRSLKLLETTSMETAVKFAFEQTREGKSCLLSTASPSYSLWKNFEEKGGEFQKYVKQCAAKKTSR